MLTSFQFTDKGPRSENQDYIVIDHISNLGRVICLADGVGGNKGGQFASQFAVDTFMSAIGTGQCSLSDAMYKAHSGLLEFASTHSNLSGMATTLTAVVIKPGGVTGVHCGDTRAYLLRGRGIKQLSDDQTEVARYLKEGKISKEDAADYPRKNVLYSALGSHKEPTIQEFDHELKVGDRIVLMSDGAYEVTSKATIRNFSIQSSDADQLGTFLVDHVSKSDTTDNYSIALAVIES